MRTQKDDALVKKALAVLEAEIDYGIGRLGSRETAGEFLALRNSNSTREAFTIIYLTQQLDTIAVEDVFLGTLGEAAVYPREILKRVLELGAASVILAHNHPGGSLKPSKMDLELTKELKLALGYIEVTVVDNIIVAGGRYVSIDSLGVL